MVIRTSRTVGLLICAALTSACGGGGGELTYDPLLEALQQDVIAEEHELVRAELASDSAPVVAAAADNVDLATGGRWGPVIQWPLVAVTIANLPDGRVLTWSGGERHSWGNTEQTYSAIWNPATGSISEKFSTGHNMFCAGTALTTEGEVFVVGGRFQGNSTESSSFDWRTDTWQQREHMAGGRWYPTTLALPDGSVYTAAGSGNVSRTSEMWSPDVGWRLHNGTDWSDLARYPRDDGTFTWQPGWPTVDLAPNGKLFHAGPTPELHWINQDSNSAPTSAGPLGFDYHGSSATTIYRPGKLLSTGGRKRPAVAGRGSVGTAWTIDISGASVAIDEVSSMNYPRSFHNSVVLPNGDVAVIGGNGNGVGFSDRDSIFATEIWNPETDSWTVAASASVPRNYHSTALLLVDGRVLSAGGGYPAANHADAQVWQPPYLFQSNGAPASRPVVVSAPELARVGDTFEVATNTPATRFTAIRMSSTTHQQNTDQRFVELEFEKLGDYVYAVTAHPNENVMLPGYWMLFALDEHGVPSVAHTILIERAGDDTQQTNLAVDGFATQSSTHVSRTAPSFGAQMANDGNISGDPSLSLAHTGVRDSNAWWEIDLGVVSQIDELRVWDRTDSAQGRINNLHILVSEKPFASDDINVLRNDADNWHHHVTTPLRRPGLVPVAATGRYVRIQLGRAGILNLAEVQVFGHALKPRPQNLAPDGIARQSSTHVSRTAPSFGAHLANDGNISGRPDLSLSHTSGRDSNAWWELDLGVVADIDELRVWDRTDYGQGRINNLHVFVSEKPFASNDVSTLRNNPDHWHHYVTEPLLRPGKVRVGQRGRYVRIQLGRAGILNLAEVQVFGYAEKLMSAIATHEDATAQIDDWQKVRFEESFDQTPIVVAGPPSFNDPEPVLVRLKKPTRHGFEYQLREWEYQDKVHGTESVSMMAMPAGRHTLGGITAEAGQVTVDNRWKHVEFSAPMPAQTVVFAQLASEFDPEMVAVRIQRVSQTGFYLRLQDESAGDVYHPYEAVNFIAMTVGEGSYAGNVIRTGIDRIESTWTTLSATGDLSGTELIAHGQGFRDPRGDALRKRKVGGSWQLRIQGELSRGGSEVRNADDAGWLLIGESEALTVTDLQTTPSVQGSQVTLTANASGTGLQYQWFFGDGNQTAYSSSPSATHSYTSAGRYPVVVNVRDAAGNTQQLNTTQIIHAPIVAAAARHSSTIVVSDTGDTWNVNPDNNTVTLSNASGVLRELAVGHKPSTLALNEAGTQLWVTNKHSATISVVDVSTRAVESTIELDQGSQPHGVVLDADHAYVVLEATGELLKIRLDNQNIVDRQRLDDHIQQLAINPDTQTLYVSRFITPPLTGEHTSAPDVSSAGARVYQVATTDLSQQSLTELGFSNAAVTEHSGPGIPNYLAAPVISPDGARVWVSSKQDAILGGSMRSGVDLRFDQTVRAISSAIDLSSDTEVLADRIDHDDAGVASASVFHPQGTVLFTALQTNQQVVASDPLEGSELARFDVGHAPQGLAVSADGNTLYVHNFLSRTVSHIDVSQLGSGRGSQTSVLATVAVVASESLPANVLLGKKHFYDARDDRLASFDYISCASCHNDGGQDGRSWDFSQFGEGVRNTTSLVGKGSGHGMLHWSGNFDEVQDFEGQIRTLAEGTGLMSDADFTAHADPLGVAKAGLSSDLDALAAYLASLTNMPDVPLALQQVDTSAGQALFQSENCGSCHAGAQYTDSATGARHDIGTIDSDSGTRLNNTLDGIDTPTLLNLAETAPYLHDGSAATVQQAIAAHNTNTLNVAQRDALAAYLLQLSSSAVSGDVSNAVTTMSLDGDLADWSGLQGFPADPTDMAAEDRIDWVSTQMAHSVTHLYITYETRDVVSPSWGYGVAIDTDNNIATGFRGFDNEWAIGADYMIEWAGFSRYTGSGDNWSWQYIGEVPIGYADNRVELSVERSALSPASVIRYGLVGQNSAFTTNAIDYYPNAMVDTAAPQSLIYRLD